MNDAERWPEEIEPPRSDASGELTVVLRLQPGLLWFQGHFPVQPIAPGFAQIEWALFYAGARARGLRLSEVGMIKFTRPLYPGERVRLRLRLEPSGGGGVVRFSFAALTARGEVPCSRGRLVLCGAS